MTPSLWNDYQPLAYWGENSGAGVTAFSLRTQAPTGPPLAQAQNFVGPFDQPPDISTVPIGAGGQYPAPAPPIFATQTEQLDWFRLVALGVGVLIGWQLLK